AGARRAAQRRRRRDHRQGLPQPARGAATPRRVRRSPAQRHRGRDPPRPCRESPFMTRGQSQLFDDVFILDGVRTPMVDYMGAFADANPIDLGIKVAREILARTGVSPEAIDSVIAGNMAPGGFDQFYVPRHIGLYAGVPVEVPALMAQRICGTGFELFRQAGEQIGAGVATNVLVVGTESMTRNPIAAVDHRGGFRLGAPVGFKDYMWEALTDPAADISMIRTAE